MATGEPNGAAVPFSAFKAEVEREWFGIVFTAPNLLPQSVTQKLPAWATQRLNLGLETVHTYVKNMYHKRHVSGRIKLLSRAARGPLWAGAGARGRTTRP